LVKITNIVKQSKPDQDCDVKLIVKNYLSLTPLFIRPIDSSIIDSYIVDTHLLSNEFKINISDIKYKCTFICITDNKAIVTTLCRTLSSD
jgi:hypothetical protein